MAARAWNHSNVGHHVVQEWCSYSTIEFEYERINRSQSWICSHCICSLTYNVSSSSSSSSSSGNYYSYSCNVVVVVECYWYYRYSRGFGVFLSFSLPQLSFIHLERKEDKKTFAKLTVKQ